MLSTTVRSAVGVGSGGRVRSTAGISLVSVAVRTTSKRSTSLSRPARR